MAKFWQGDSADSGGSLRREKNGRSLRTARALQEAERSSLSPNSSRITQGTKIEGKLRFSGSLHFAGELDGGIQAEKGHLELSKSSQVHGDIDCLIIQCQGQVFGNIRAHGKSVLHSDCKLVGDIVTGELSIQHGAQIAGCCKMLGDRQEMDFFSMPIDHLRSQLDSIKN